MTQGAPSLSDAFKKGRPALVCYVMAGYPDRETSLEALCAVADAGADVIELGVPYTDQLADGPVIVRAAAEARVAAGGTFGLSESLAVLSEFRRRRPGGPPVVVMTYLNPLMRVGYETSAAMLRDAGASGVIIPDLPPDMAADWLAASAGLDTVFLAAPTSTPERLALVGAASRGFVYCVSTTGITGEREGLADGLAETVGRVRAATSLPVAVGFGISSPEQATAVGAIANGVVVGSAIVRRQTDIVELATYVNALRAALS